MKNEGVLSKPGPECRIPVGSEPGSRTRRMSHALPIVRDEFGRLFPNGLLASIARLCFTGTISLRQLHQTMESSIIERLHTP